LPKAFLFGVGGIAARTIDVENVSQGIRLYLPQIIAAALFIIIVTHGEDEGGNGTGCGPLGRDDWHLVFGKLQVELWPEGVEA
jgi:hypothetical protein